MMTIRDVMTTSVLTVRSDTPLKDVARLLIDSGISGVPVVDADGAVLGVVSEGDFLAKGQGPEAIRHRRLAGLIGDTPETRARLGKVDARTAGQAMSAPPITIRPERPIREAAAMMAEQHVNRLPVVDDGRLIGIITRADLVRAYLRTDEELARTVLDDVLLKALWLNPASFDVTVTNGEVWITGNVERRSTAAIVEETIRLVPGIIAVHPDIRWAFDDRDLKPAEADPAFPHGLR